MYAIVKTGGKQYKVAPGDKLNIEKLDVEPWATRWNLRPSASSTATRWRPTPRRPPRPRSSPSCSSSSRATRQLVFKFKKRKNYKKLRGHRQSYARPDRVRRSQGEKPAVRRLACRVGRLEGRRKVRRRRVS